MPITASHQDKLAARAAAADHQGPYYARPTGAGTWDVLAGPNDDTVAIGLTHGDAQHLAACSPDVIATIVTDTLVADVDHAAVLPAGSILDDRKGTVWLREHDGWLGTGEGDIAHGHHAIAYPARLVRRGPTA